MLTHTMFSGRVFVAEVYSRVESLDDFLKLFSKLGFKKEKMVSTGPTWKYRLFAFLPDYLGEVQGIFLHVRVLAGETSFRRGTEGYKRQEHLRECSCLC